jgi:hypothetical protein
MSTKIAIKYENLTSLEGIFHTKVVFEGIVLSELINLFILKSGGNRAKYSNSDIIISHVLYLSMRWQPHSGLSLFFSVWYLFDRTCRRFL